MIRKILTYYTEQLNEYLSRNHHQPEGMATVGQIGTTSEKGPNKMIVSLINLERETSGDTVFMRRTENGYIGEVPVMLLNMYILLAAIYDNKRYAESLSVLSDTLAFIQSMPKFEIDEQKYTVEIVPISTMDLHNIWTTMGGQYYPSVICKLRGLAIDSSIITSSSSITGETIVKT
jgi:hypothetical protein